MRWPKRWLREFIIEIVLSHIQIGAHCGLCGKWVPDALAECTWAWTICKDHRIEEAFEEFIIRETEAAIEDGIIDENTGLPFELEEPEEGGDVK